MWEEKPAQTKEMQVEYDRSVTLPGAEATSAALSAAGVPSRFCPQQFIGHCCVILGEIERGPDSVMESCCMLIP